MAIQCTIAIAAAPNALSLSRSFILRPPPLSSAASRSVTIKNNPHGHTTAASTAADIDAIFKQKRVLRSRVKKELKNMDPTLRSQEDNAIQNIILEAPWFKTCKRLCAYISCSALREVDTSNILSHILQNPAKDAHSLMRKNLYVPRVEDRNRNMRMLSISSIDDLIANSMNILEPAPVDAEGNERKMGLGTSTSKEGKEYFNALENHKKDFTWEDEQDGKQSSLPLVRRKSKQGRIGSDSLSLALTLIRRRSSLSTVTLSTRSLYCFRWLIFNDQYLQWLMA